jgi:hypothetical protein
MFVIYIFFSNVQPYLDIKYQVYKTKKEFDIGKDELEFNAQRCELLRLYPEMRKNVSDDPCRIGFEYSKEDEYEEEYDDDYDDNEEMHKKTRR